MLLLSLPNELLLHVAKPLGEKDINSFLKVNRRLASLLTPCLHALAIQETGSMTALQWAAWNGHESLARLVLEKGADINFQYPRQDNWTPATALHLAVEAGNEGIVRFLLEHGADTSIPNPRGGTVLHSCTRINSIPIMRLLLQYGADISAGTQGDTPLVWAASFGFGGMVRVLLENGADISCTMAGASPLHWAANFGNEAVVKVLLEYGADTSMLDIPTGLTALDWASSRGHTEVVNMLLEHQTNNIKPPNNEKSLQVAPRA